MTLQSLDNYRLSMHGIDNGGLFQKKSHILQSENDMNAAHVSSVALDRLQNRQTFCDIVNAIWGVGISAEFVGSNEEQEAPGDNYEEEGGDNYEE